MLLLIWWIYDGYAWLTNAIATDRAPVPAAPARRDGRVPRDRPRRSGRLRRRRARLRPRLPRRRRCSTPACTCAERRSRRCAAILRIVAVQPRRRRPRARRRRARRRLAVGAVGARRGLLWVTPQFTTVEGFVVSVSHFVERHGLVVIVALGESIVVDRRRRGRACRSMAASCSSLCCRSASALPSGGCTSATRRRSSARCTTRRPERRAAARPTSGSGTGTTGCCSAVVALAAGLKKAIGDPYDPLGGWIAVGLAAGAALFLLCEVRAFAGRSESPGAGSGPLVAAAAVLATLFRSAPS